MCQHPNSLAYVAGAPAHRQREREGDPWVKMDPGFSIRRLIEPMRLIAEQCAVPPQNLVRAGRAALCDWPVTAWTDREHAVLRTMGPCRASSISGAVGNILSSSPDHALRLTFFAIPRVMRASCYREHTGLLCSAQECWMSGLPPSHLLRQVWVPSIRAPCYIE